MLGLPDATRACLFDLDGVLTDTASVHAAAWKQMFDDYLRARAARLGTPFEPFDEVADYGPYVDGKPRLDGTRGFLRSRGIELPDGEPDRPADAETINGLAMRKNAARPARRSATLGVDVYPGSVRYLHAVRDAGLKIAVVSSSANAEQVLEVAGLTDFIDHRVDGVVAKERHLPGKPAPDTFLAAAADFGVPKEQAVVFEDALAGVAAGPGGRVRVRRRGRPAGPGRGVARARRGRRRQRPRRPAGGGVMSPDPARPFTVEPWVVREPTLDMDSMGIRRDGLRALQRPHRSARQPGRGGAARTPPGPI